MRLEHITWPQAERYFSENDLILFATGSLECHGRHLALGTDTLIPDRLLELIEEQNDKILIAPTLPYGCTPSLVGYPGGVDLGADLYTQLLLRICDDLYNSGARRFAVLNGHGGNVRCLDQVAYHLQKKGAILAELNWWLMVWDMNPAWKGGHGGGEETAGVMGVNPAFVDMSEIETPQQFQDFSDTIKAQDYNAVYKGVTVHIPRLMPSITKNGWVGPDHPNTATEAWGKEMLQTCADYIVDFLEEFKKIDIEKAFQGL